MGKGLLFRGRGKRDARYSMGVRFWAVVIIVGFLTNLFSGFAWGSGKPMGVGGDFTIIPTAGTIVQAYKGTVDRHVYCIQDFIVRYLFRRM